MSRSGQVSLVRISTEPTLLTLLQSPHPAHPSLPLFRGKATLERSQQIQGGEAEVGHGDPVTVEALGGGGEHGEASFEEGDVGVAFKCELRHVERGERGCEATVGFQNENINLQLKQKSRR
jgi:hypothetical protein